MKLAYADPPYIGKAKLHYDCAEINFPELIARLENDYDGFALSCNSVDLKILLPMFKTKIRIGAWVKPWAAIKKNVWPVYAWEPVIFRTPKRKIIKHKMILDWIQQCPNMTKNSKIIGKKPMAFSFWIFEILRADPSDDFTDLYHGSGAVKEAWKLFTRMKKGLWN
jgi:hypothetical protein